MEQYQDEINNLLLNTAINKEQVFDFSFVRKNILSYYSKLRELKVDQYIMGEQKWNETAPK